MDKFEYKVRSEEIKALIARKEYAEAVKIADTIDWRRVRSVMMLCTISDLYKINRRLEDSKNILLMAYDRHPGGRTIIYSLCELCIKTEDIVGAIEYYKEFVQVAPRDTGRFILQYKLYEAQDVSLEERIAVLEEFKKRDYREKWAYELAYLYHRIGLATKCVEECDDLILWFGEGKYVIKAMELKMLHEPLTPDQQLKYNNRFVKNVEDSMTRVLPTVQIQEAVKQSEQQLSHTQQILEAPTQRLPLEEIDIQVKMVDVGQYDTINMQKELAESLQEILPPGQEITPETGIIQPERIEEAMIQGGFQPEMMQGGYAQPETQTEYAQSEMGYASEAYATQEENYSEETEVPEEVQAWGEASPAFTFYDNKSEQLAEELAAWNQVESAAFTFYNPTTGNTTTFTPEEQAKLEEDLANWNKAESAAFTFYDPKTGNTTTFTPEEQEKLIADLAAWNQVKSAAFTFYDFKGEAQKIAQQQAAEANAQPVAEVLYTEPEEEPAQVSAQEEITRAIVAPLLQETGDMSDVATELQEQTFAQPSGGMTEVFFGETGEIRLDSQYNAGYAAEQPSEPVVQYEAQPTVPEVEDTSRIVMDQIKEDVIAAKMAASAQAAIPPQALPSQPLDKILSMEYDGQLSMVMPDDERIEKQITGQLSIEDILSEWERMKKESEAKCMENVRQRVLQQTGDMFAEFDEAAKSGLLEQLEGLAQATEAAQEIEAEEVSEETEEAAYEVIYEDDEVAADESEEYTEEPVEAAEVESGVEEIFFQEDEISEDEEEPAYEQEEIVTEETEEVVDEVEEVADEIIEEIPEDGIEEAISEESEVEYVDEPLEDPLPVITGEEVFFQEEEEEAEENEDSEEELGNFFAPRTEEPVIEEDASKLKEAGAEVYFSDNSEETAEQSTEQNSIDDSSEEEAEEAESLQEEQEKPKVRDFTREERELFASFVQDRASKEQLIQTLENISLASYTGNVIVTGEEAETTFALAKNLVRNFQLSDSNFSGKIAKISGDGLNKKNIPETVNTLENGALLIQNASGMNEETVKRLVKSLEQENHGIIVVLEDTKKSMNRLLEKNEILKTLFNSRVDIKAMDNDSLVEFAKKYAYEKEYSIDEMGVLALHTRIADMQTLDHAVTVAEVKEIMDEAIENANRKSISHFFDVVLSKRYDEEDMIVLREKDFI